ncbi:MAG: RNA polymerase sigma factor [Betaproteobacteria bacterium]|nr:MAG: RNA polymerase sigma factor [Betaproteobacteria bacterium]
MTTSSALNPVGRDADRELAQQIAAGDHDAFRILMRRYNQTLYRTARGVLRNDADAEDVVQEGWLLAYRSMHGFRGEARLSTWLIRIVVNLALRRRQGQTRDAAMRVDGIAAANFADFADTPVEESEEMRESPSASPESNASNAELRRLLEAHIDRLPDLYREVFILRAVEELDVAETAAVLGLPEATVRTRFFRARHQLREALAQDIDLAVGDAFSFAGHRCDRIVAGVFRRLQQEQS